MEKSYINTQLSALWRVIYVLIILVVIQFVFLAVAYNGLNNLDSDTGYVRKSPYRQEISQINRRLDITDSNTKTLFKNDSIIVSKQTVYQTNQEKKSALSTLFKLIFL